LRLVKRTPSSFGAQRIDGRFGMTRFKAGDRVVVRPASEILAMLDDRGRLHGLPFMPEMLGYVGGAFSVARTVVKVCNTIDASGTRTMNDAVYLDDLRCDGCAHGGCQADCRFYWKEQWLEPDEGNARRPTDPIEVDKARKWLEARTRNGDRYVCQATEARAATIGPVSIASPNQYVREIREGNIGWRELLRVAGRALACRFGPKFRLMRVLPQRLVPRWTPGEVSGRHEPGDRLDLRPGEWVEVRSREEIARTLGMTGKNKGLAFSYPEMLPLVGKRFRVRGRVERIIDEATGRMIEMKHDCVTLDGTCCTGEYAAGRWFCWRGIYPYWREAWLKRIPTGQGDTSHQARDAGLEIDEIRRVPVLHH
jgi:hypothetical protein